MSCLPAWSFTCCWPSPGLNFYDFVETLFPGSFSNVATADSDPNFRVALFYFSMTTITTVGYGDITPLSPLARMLAITEALTGQIYLVVMVATLVGLRATALHESRERRKREP